MAHGVWDGISGPIGEGWARGRFIVLVSAGRPPACRRGCPRGSQIPYLLADQGHWDAVLGKKTFFKAFQFCGLNLFIKITYNTVLKCEVIRITSCWI